MNPYLTAPEDLGGLLEGEPPYRADQLRHWLYQTPVVSSDRMSNLPAATRGWLERNLWPFELEIEQVADGGRTRKWLFRTADGSSIETVLMGYPNRTTLCISSQVGCAMGCTFCATGQFGFDRHLEAGEMVAQIAFANALLSETPLPGSPARVTNVVFMGMGEPLANYRRLREALRRMVEVMDISARSITVSTVGVVPGILKLADEPWAVNLAVSLHAADDRLRSSLVPLNERYPLGAVVAASNRFFESKGRRVSIEWTMIDGVNDTSDQADKLVHIAQQMRAHVNVISMNPTPLSEQRPSTEAAVERFMERLRSARVNVTRRDTRGQSIDAACGQLRLRASR